MCRPALAVLLPLALLGGACTPSGAPLCAADRTHTVPSSATEDTTFRVGPYLQHTTTDSVAISWETVAPGGTTVEYGADASYGQVADGPAGTMHQLVVTGLAPATLYHYRACTDGTCTADLLFSTAPAPAQPFRFVVYGDTRSDPATHRAVVDMIIESAPILAINVGDVVTDGNVRSQYKDEHFDPTRRLGHSVPIYVAVGNHEEHETKVPTFREYMMFPYPPDDPEHETSYAFTYGDAFFLVVDTNNVNFSPIIGDNAPLWVWIKEQVASPAALGAKWRFAFMHYPPDSRCYLTNEYPSVAVKDYLVPLFQEHAFQALFAGHQHLYERFDFAGFPAFTTGGGGAGLDDITTCTRDLPELQRIESLYHHLTVDLGCGSAVVRAVGLDGAEFDAVTLLP